MPVSGVTALQALRDKATCAARADGAGHRGGRRRGHVRGADREGVRRRGDRRGSTSKLDLVRSIGADDVIDYTREDFTDGSRTWDVIVDTAGRRPLRELRRALTPKGTLVVVGGDGGGRWTGGFFRGMLRGPLVSLFVGQRLGGLNSKVSAEDLRGARRTGRGRQGHAGRRAVLLVARDPRCDPRARDRTRARQARDRGVTSAPAQVRFGRRAAASARRVRTTLFTSALGNGRP